MHSLQRVGVAAITYRFCDQVRDLEHLFFFHATRSNSWCTDADAARLENWIGIEWDRILVHGDAGAIEDLLRFLPMNVFRAKIDKHEVIIGAARNDAVTVFGEPSRKSLGIDDDLTLIIAKLRLERFVKTNCFRRDHVHEWTALHSWKKHGVDLFRELLLAQDNAAAGAAQAFVRRSRNKLRVRNRAGVLPACHWPCDVRHVDEKNRANRIGNLPQPRKINDAWVRGRAGRYHDWLHLFGLLL